MGPMDDATFGIPFVFAFEGYAIARLQIINPGRQVDIMRDQQTVAIGKPDQKTLMTAAIAVIRKQLGHDACRFDRQIATLRVKGLHDLRIDGYIAELGCGLLRRRLQ